MEPQQPPTVQATEPSPKYFRFDRRVVGILDITKHVLESSAIGSISFGAGAHEWWPVLAGAVVGVVRVALSYGLPTIKIKNPL